ncbi:hypothetical protein F2P81_020294 [Scophthalmus maximus]|uniref:Uncharacterized protein n=1 Tax=Scophthalmus maximus TaxID=52904 RepID=A0A6A4RZM7_SCOMX|nr:hypothetical protein F2P81_020294 [Scophthalmus maximus]
MAHGESSVALNGTQISYIGHDCKDIPGFLGDTYGQFARRLDLSFNQLRNGRDRCRNQCEVCGNKRQQLTEKLCRAAAYTSRLGDNTTVVLMLKTCGELMKNWTDNHST